MPKDVQMESDSDDSDYESDYDFSKEVEAVE